MPIIRRSELREQKKVADFDENSLIVHSPSIHASMAVMNTWVRFAPATNCRDSMMEPCMVRTTYQRGAGVGASGLKAARRRTILGKYRARGLHVHPVFGEARHCMER